MECVQSVTDGILGTKKMVEIGMPVGVVAAQSIGEPGTQLTLKTKHAAGVVGVSTLPKDFQELRNWLKPEFQKLFRLFAEISGKVKSCRN